MDTHVKTLIAQTRSSDPALQKQSALELGQCELTTYRQEAIHALHALLEHPQLDVRETAKQAMITIGGEDLVELFIADLTSSSTTVVNYAIDILSTIGNDKIDRILDLLNAKDHDVRKFGCDILGNLHYNESVYDLIELLSDPHINVAIAAGEALGKLGDPEAVPHLIRALHHPDTWMRCIAAEALGNIGDVRAVDAFLALPKDEEPIVFYTVLKAMSNLPDPRVFPYILALLDANPKLASPAVQTIERIAERQGDGVYAEIITAGLAEIFLPLLDSEHGEMLCSTIHLIGKLRLNAAYQPLQRLVHDPQENVAANAVWALMQVAAPDERIPLLQQLIAQTTRDTHKHLLEQTLRSIKQTSNVI